MTKKRKPTRTDPNPRQHTMTLEEYRAAAIEGKEPHTLSRQRPKMRERDPR